MPRVNPYRRPADFGPETNAEAARDAAALFAGLFPGAADPAFDDAHLGLAIAAQNPKLALNLARFTGFVAGELPFCQRRDLRELAIQAVNLHFGNGYSFRARAAGAAAAGISLELQEALPGWRDSPRFNAEQRLVLEYAEAVAAGAVPDKLFARVAAVFGEPGAVELTAVVALFAFWAMFLNAIAPDLSDGERATRS